MYTTNYIKIGIFFHIICGGFMLTNSDIIPVDDHTIPEGKEEELGPFRFAIYKRFIFNSVHGNLYISFFGILLVFLILKNTVWKLLITQFKSCTDSI